MPRNFNLSAGQWREPKFQVRVLLGVLLAANIIAAGILLFPPGGSAEDLDKQQVTLQAQLQTARVRLEKTRDHAAAVEKGRSAGDTFLDSFFLARRTAFGNVVAELQAAAASSKIATREFTYAIEPIEGSDTLDMMSISGNYEGTYPDLLHLIHEIDRSKQLLIIESLNAAPQQGTQKLTVAIKLQTFVREDGTRLGGSEAAQ